MGLVVGRLVLMVAFAEASVTFATLGFPSCQASGDDAGADAACAGSAVVTSTTIALPWVAAER